METLTRFLRRALLAALFALDAAPAHACSPRLFPDTGDGLHLVGVATPDVMRAGAGGMDYVVEPGGQDPDPASVAGQVVRVERLGGAEAAGLPAGADRVVLVPWAYLWTCTTVRWTGSANWVASGVRGLFWGRLRPRGQWVDGLPTVDVEHAAHLPYVGSGAGVPDAEERAGPPLSVDQAFELAQRLPLSRDRQADPGAARRPLLDWARAHPVLARRYPASVLIREASAELRAERLKEIHLPLAGTYRFTVSVDGGAPRTFYARTRATPGGEWAPGADFENQPVLDEPFRGYLLWLEGTVAADSFAAGSAGGGDEVARGGWLSVLAEPDAGPGGAWLWRGTIELHLVSRQFPGDPVFGGLGDAAFERYYRRSRAREPDELHARLLVHRDGSVSVEQVSRLDDGRVVEIRGERVSTVTLAQR
jgi:hypothetical protein